MPFDFSYDLDFTPHDSDFGLHDSDFGLHDNHLLDFDHHVDCDTHYPIHTDNSWNNITELPENTVCNYFETHDTLNDVRECLQDEKSADIGFVERHIDCFTK